jgi:hypothetical protein
MAINAITKEKWSTEKGFREIMCNDILRSSILLFNVPSDNAPNRA